MNILQKVNNLLLMNTFKGVETIPQDLKNIIYEYAKPRFYNERLVSSTVMEKILSENPECCNDNECVILITKYTKNLFPLHMFILSCDRKHQHSGLIKFEEGHYMYVDYPTWKYKINTIYNYIDDFNIPYLLGCSLCVSSVMASISDRNPIYLLCPISLIYYILYPSKISVRGVIFANITIIFNFFYK